jgi:hypothetical protein
VGRAELLAVVALILGGCGATPEQVATGVVGVTVGSVAVIGRTPADALYSLLTGKDCSVVRLDQGKTYCKPAEPPPVPPEFCTRSLGVVDCWQDPAALPDRAQGVAEGPSTLTPAQEVNRTHRWPPL